MRFVKNPAEKVLYCVGLLFIVLAFIGLNFGTEIMLGVFMLLYMSAALLQDDSCEDERNEHSARCIDIKNAAL